MTLHEVSTLIRSSGGEVWNKSTEQGASVLLSTINGQHCRILVPLAGKSPGMPKTALTFQNHIVFSAEELQRWLSTIRRA